ncbi:AraC family transcriptional regulator [Ruminococcus sp. Marseille-P6503]|uniref:helix-turn-helix domain-containing protein n=1 Tax=Ruminococcus sp. Marseille-P6503 TaxID=2364796 RepID=UPI000F526F99|nr:AraC family transcriptional regulator [Ruminococcus sp. Marseille-P6503]
MLSISDLGRSPAQPPQFNACQESGISDYLLIYANSEACFVLDGREFSVKSDTIVIFDNCLPLIHCVESCVNIYDWLHFQCSRTLIESWNIVFEKGVYIGEGFDASGYIKLLSESFVSENPLRRQICSLLLQALLMNLSDCLNKRQASNRHYRKLMELRREIYRCPENDWSISKISRTMNISPAYFQAIYKRQFGISCGSDIINSRIEAGKELLSESRMTIYEVAFSCGYNSEVHFSRQFKQITGVTPSEYRRSIKSG